MAHSPLPAQMQSQPHPHSQSPAHAYPHMHPHACTTAPAPIRFRAAKACRACHQKRVKCDASERGTPCTRCEQRREPECTLMQSRRGIYARKPRRPPQQHPASTPADPPATQGGSSSSSADADAVTDAAAAAAAADATATEPTATPPYPPPAPNAPSSVESTGNASSYREISWATTFDHLLERYHNGGDALNKCSITYIGEAFPLGIVLKGLQGGVNRPLLHHPGPPCADQEAAADNSRLSHPPGMCAEEIAFLESKHVFTAPSDETVDALINIFFECVFPLYPIVNPYELLLQHKSRRIPWMLLHALCFISATYCPIRVIHRAGFDSRTEARSLFHDKAKALFDIGYEGNKIVAVQVSIIMSFWGGGPSNYWNFYTWICTGVTIAETLGFHRSMARATIEPQDRSLIKRLWWILVIRDATCASLVGRPFRVNLDHCDADPLTKQDFSYDVNLSLECMTSPLAQLSGLYQIHATKLSLILRHVIAARFYPQNQSTSASSALQEMMTAWRNDLPPEMRWSDRMSSQANVFLSTLRILYNHNIILAHVNGSMDEEGDVSNGSCPHRVIREEVISDAAQQIASTSCDVVINPDDLLPPHELFHGLFIAAVVFYMQTKSHNAMAARSGMSGLTNCKMALHAVRDTWDASPWISQLFDKALCLSLAPHRPAARAHVGSISTEAEMGFDDMAAFDLDGYSIPSYGGWAGHLLLGNFFDVPLDPSSSMPMAPTFGEGPG
ncbi:hypothetical protein PSPO01_15321 [Paraphaeosphaeria sporulosa]